MKKPKMLKRITESVAKTAATAVVMVVTGAPPAEADTELLPKVKDGEKVTIILLPNTTQPVDVAARKSSTLKDGTRPWISTDSTTPLVGREYLGEKHFWDAFQTVYDRLAPALTSSGRVRVLHASKIDETITDERTYICTYKLVQARKTGFKRDGKEEYIVGISMHAWNYGTGESFAPLTRTVDVEAFDRTPENAFKFVVRYLAFIMLEAVAPVTILEKDGTDVSVSAGGEILQKGDILKAKKGLRGGPKLRVEETDLATSVCVIINKADIPSVEERARVIFPLPSEEPRNPPAVAIKMSDLTKSVSVAELANLKSSLTSRDMGLTVISLDGVAMEQVKEEDILRHCDYELVYTVTSYVPGAKTPPYRVNGEQVNLVSNLKANVTLRDLKTKDQVGKTITVDIPQNGFTSSGGGLASLPPAIIERAANQIAADVRKTAATLKK